MKEYVHGGDIYSALKTHNKVIDFSANINPLGMPKGVIKAIADSICLCENYPDPFCAELTNAIASAEGVLPDDVIVGNGADDLIFRLVLAVKPKKAILFTPTFAEYEKALQTLNCEIVFYPLREENDFLLTGDFLSSLDETIDMIFLCNPNNPTGQLADKRLLIKIVERCKELGILLVMDECFNDFLDNSEMHTIKDYLPEFENLFILKAFTKIYAMPGIRLGYGLSSNHGLLDKIFNCSQAWSVSVLAQKAGIEALQEKEYIHETMQTIRAEREFLKAELAKLELKVIGSNANYIFFKYIGDINLKEELFKKAILIRDCGNYRGLGKGFYRVAVKSREDNFALILALSKILK